MPKKEAVLTERLFRSQCGCAPNPSPEPRLPLRLLVGLILSNLPENSLFPWILFISIQMENLSLFCLWQIFRREGKWLFWHWDAGWTLWNVENSWASAIHWRLIFPAFLILIQDAKFTLEMAFVLFLAEMNYGDIFFLFLTVKSNELLQKNSLRIVKSRKSRVLFQKR